MIAILVGLIFIGAGFWGLVTWSSDFLSVMRGLGPISLFLGGIVGILAGVSSLQARRKNDGSK
jgi:hypothetical protein